MQLLQEMQERLDRVRPELDPVLFWTAGAILTQLYLDAKDFEKAFATVKRMELALAKKPDRKRSAELMRLKQRLKAGAGETSTKPRQAANL